MLTMEQILNGTIDPTEFAIDHLGLDLISSDVEVIFDIGTGDQTFAKEAINKGFKVLKTDARPQWYKVEDVIKVKVDYEDGTCYVIEPRVYFIDEFGNRRIDLIATEEIETRTLEQIITENSTAEISNTVVKISDVNLRYFIETCGTNMQELINEIRKLIEYAGENGTIEKQDIDSLCIKKLESVIFDLTDNLGKKETNKALQVLKNLIYAKGNTSAARWFAY